MMNSNPFYIKSRIKYLSVDLEYRFNFEITIGKTNTIPNIIMPLTLDLSLYTTGTINISFHI